VLWSGLSRRPAERLHVRTCRRARSSRCTAAKPLLFDRTDVLDLSCAECRTCSQLTESHDSVPRMDEQGVGRTNNGFAAVHRLDLASGKFETWEPFRRGVCRKAGTTTLTTSSPTRRTTCTSPTSPTSTSGASDGKTGALTLFTIPTPRSAPRRAQMEPTTASGSPSIAAQDRVSTRAPTLHRCGTGRPPAPYWSQPYDVQLDKNGEAWTGSMLNDRVLRLDPRPAPSRSTCLPRSTNIRRVFVDSSTTPVTFWVGSNHGASIVKLEPLD